MKISMKHATFAVILGVMSAPVLAQVYGEVSYLSAVVKATVAGNDVKFSPDGVVGYLGYELIENLAVEGSLIVGVGSSNTTVNGVNQRNPVNTKMNQIYGVYVRPKAMLSESLEVFGRLGYVEGKTTSSTAIASSSTTKSDWIYGVGANYYLNQRTYLAASWLHSNKKDGVTLDGFTFGLGYKF
jgi:opacity protein-like surface antigen